MTKLIVPQETRFNLQHDFLEAYRTNTPDAAVDALHHLSPETRDMAQDPILLYSGKERSVPVGLRHLAQIAKDQNPAWACVDNILAAEFGVGEHPPDMPGPMEMAQFNCWPTDFPTFSAVEKAASLKLSPSQTAALVSRRRAIDAAQGVTARQMAVAS
jgi:hypothetical protein